MNLLETMIENGSDEVKKAKMAKLTDRCIRTSINGCITSSTIVPYLLPLIISEIEQDTSIIDGDSTGIIKVKLEVSVNELGRIMADRLTSDIVTSIIIDSIVKCKAKHCNLEDISDTVSDRIISMGDAFVGCNSDVLSKDKKSVTNGMTKDFGAAFTSTLEDMNTDTYSLRGSAAFGFGSDADTLKLMVEASPI